MIDCPHNKRCLLKSIHARSKLQSLWSIIRLHMKRHLLYSTVGGHRNTRTIPYSTPALRTMDFDSFRSAFIHVLQCPFQGTQFVYLVRYLNKEMDFASDDRFKR